MGSKILLRSHSRERESGIFETYRVGRKSRNLPRIMELYLYKVHKGTFYEHAKQCESTNTKMAAYPRL